ncbi:ubiquinol-cytochrome C chaperone family protein [Sphingomonas sp. AOB5]|uniref:ubiquinol-cytochrome C chaperone family protein n=1 Tax=Sphingomonas sp. AOB5 TaxID=3034017 RepID=UPI0023F8757C|nr:ubiquinol-cytochrome C chaperone family protein [Sphingomonas sp. AOB5]MDF7776071.1 ubiquinol-cytochrome C chaperone family protein [Sphingomonas sp. AOB5]
MSIFQRLFGKPDRGTAPLLYDAVVKRARQPHWYVEGAVPDTVDGRFDMIAAVMSFVLLRLEGEPAATLPSTQLAEVFIEDMDGQLREWGVGDIIVGKRIGKMMGMIGGRLGAYRTALESGDLKPALVRNVYRGNAPAPEALAHVEAKLMALHHCLVSTPVTTLLDGELPE